MVSDCWLHIATEVVCQHRRYFLNLVLHCVSSMVKRLRIVCIYQPDITEYLLEDALPPHFPNTTLLAHVLSDILLQVAMNCRCVEWADTSHSALIRPRSLSDLMTTL